MSVMKKKIPGVILLWTLLAATFLVTGCARDAAPPLPREPGRRGAGAGKGVVS